MKNNFYFQQNIFLLLLLIYFAQGSLYESGSIISQIILFVIILFGSFSFLKCISHGLLKHRFVIAWTLLVILNIFGYIFSADFDNSVHFSNFKNILFTSLTFYSIYYFTSQNKINDKTMFIFSMLMLPLAILQFYYYEKQQFLEFNQEKTVNNISYIFVGLIPFLFFVKKRIYSIILLILIVSFIIISGKRGAAISGIAGILVYFVYIFKSIKNKSKIEKLVSYFTIILLLISFTYFTFSFIETDSFLFDRLTSGYKSNRDTNYQQIFSYWYESNNFFSLLFGFGFASSMTMNSEGVLAHNDWLEIISNFGLIGFFVYILLLYSLLKTILLTTDKQYKYTLLSILIIWSLISLFSMFYNELNSFFYAMVLGYIYGKTKSITRSVNIRL